MARRTRAKRRRSSPRAVSLLDVMETYALASVVTVGLMGVSPFQFFTGRNGGMK